MIVLDLPMPPPLSATTNNNQRSGRIKSKRYKQWIKDAGNEILHFWSIVGPKHIAGRVVLKMALGCNRNKDGSVSKMRWDISNRIKALEDLIVTHGIIEDDSLVEDLRIYRTPDVPPGRIQMCISSAERGDS